MTPVAVLHLNAVAPKMYSFLRQLPGHSFDTEAHVDERGKGGRTRVGGGGVVRSVAAGAGVESGRRKAGMTSDMTVSGRVQIFVI
jgi:hypothetical protein